VYRRGINPQLDDFLSTPVLMNIARWSFTMDYPHAGIHPLGSARINYTIVTTAIAVMNTTLKNECDG
jgi:hypothetical protein